MIMSPPIQMQLLHPMKQRQQPPRSQPTTVVSLRRCNTTRRRTISRSPPLLMMMMMLGFVLLQLFILLLLTGCQQQRMVVQAGMASDKPPTDLPEGFCPKATGDLTATTGECMCHWQHKDGCKGSKCSYQMGLSWYHYSCKDCECVPEPK